MKTISTFYILSVLPIIISGCETDATNVRPPEYMPKIVIGGFLSPSDTVTYLRITSNNKLFTSPFENRPVFGNISAYISDGEQEIKLDTVNRQFEFGLYILDHNKMKIEYGKTYFIKAISEKGYQAEALCKVPEKRSFKINIDTLTVYDEDYAKLAVRASFQDMPGERNFYRIFIFIKSPNPKYSSGWQRRYLRVEDHLFTDYKMDGKELVSIAMPGINWEMEEKDSVYLIAKLYNVEESYYLYHKSLDNYIDGDIPFTEPTMAYTNVTNGLGIFAAYTVDSAVVKIK